MRGGLGGLEATPALAPAPSADNVILRLCILQFQSALMSPKGLTTAPNLSGVNCRMLSLFTDMARFVVSGVNGLEPSLFADIVRFVSVHCLFGLKSSLFTDRARSVLTLVLSG